MITIDEFHYILYTQENNTTLYYISSITLKVACFPDYMVAVIKMNYVKYIVKYFQDGVRNIVI